MKTIFLPGYSIRNREWQNDIISALPQLEFIPFSFQHWQEGIDDISKFDYTSEFQKLTDLASNNQPVNILAKSIGTVLAMRIILEKSVIITKSVLCGIPINSLPISIDLIKQLTNLSGVDFTIVQNTADPVGSASEVFALVKKYLPNSKCIETDRNDHHYPFPEIFSNYLK